MKLEVVVDSRKKSNLKYPSGTYNELDIWIPKYNIAFEFQDAYHYTTTWYSQRSLSNITNNDYILFTIFIYLFIYLFIII